MILDDHLFRTLSECQDDPATIVKILRLTAEDLAIASERVSLLPGERDAFAALAAAVRSKSDVDQGAVGGSDPRTQQEGAVAGGILVSTWHEEGVDAIMFRDWIASRGVEFRQIEKHHADLALAFACSLRDPVATAHFDRDYLGKAAGSIVSKMRLPKYARDDVHQILRGELLMGPQPRIGKYSGYGSLRQFVHVTAYRAALETARELGRSARVRSDIGASSPESPESHAIREEFREGLEGALQDAFALLSVGDRAMLRQTYVENLSAEKIARSHGVSQTTVSRHLAGIRQAILDSVRVKLGMVAESEEELRALFQQLEIDLSVSVSLALRD